MQPKLVDLAEEWRLTLSIDIRTIYLSCDDSLVTYIKNKDATTKVNISVMYEQHDVQFNDRLFEETAKDTLVKVVSDAGRVEGLLVDISY
jgi:hypothetical protein